MSKPKWGQVFLVDSNILDKLLRHLTIQLEDNILEIGCGDGILTKVLAHKTKNLTVVEIDEQCIFNTKQCLDDSKTIAWIHADVLQVDFKKFKSNIRLIANIPYYISAKLIQKIAYSADCFTDVTIMVQKEFAQKCVARAYQKTYTSLSVFTQYYFEVTYLFDVSKTCFRPIPDIDSAFIRLIPKRDLDLNFSKLFENVVMACFWGKRKKLSTSLNASPHLNLVQDVRKINEQIPFLDRRADQLSVTEYQELTQCLLPFLSIEEAS